MAPVTVQNLVTAVKAGSFTGSAFSKISPGEFLQLGKQGTRRMGDVEPPAGALQVGQFMILLQLHIVAVAVDFEEFGVAAVLA